MYDTRDKNLWGSSLHSNAWCLEVRKWNCSGIGGLSANWPDYVLIWASYILNTSWSYAKYALWTLKDQRDIF